VTTPIRVGMLAARPVYYHAPLYRRVAAHPGIDFTAIFASTAGVRPVDGGFGQFVTWDVDPLEGYRSVFLKRADQNAGGDSTFSFRDFDVARVVRSGRFDLLWMHGYNSITHILAAATQLAQGGGLLLREEQTLLHPRPMWKRALKRLGLAVILRHAYGLYIGSQNRRWLEYYGVPPERLFFTPYTVDNEELQASARLLGPSREEIRQQFGLGNKPVILTVCRLIPKKQPLALLEAFRRLRADWDCALLIIGSGVLEEAMRHKVAIERIPDVVFGGFLNRSEIARAYTAADIFTLASKEHETWGLVVNEAMNFALPVVVSNKVGCAADLVREGENGFVVAADDPQSLADRLSLLVGSSNLRRRFGAASHDLIRGWSYEVAADGLLQAIAHAVGPERWATADARRRSDRKFAAKTIT
jgi:glycosyltransferase involved in cell wall biosynthesis